MARGSGGIRYYIDGDASGLQKALGQAESRIGRVGKSMGIALGAAAAAGTAAVGAFGKLGLDEAREQEAVAARTANVIKTTGGAANVTAAQVEKLAAAIQRQTGSADDAVQAGANMLLTFRNIRNEAGAGNDIFNQTVRITNDLSVAMGTDMQQASIQVGKALNDPVRGITALQRVGITFNETQREQIKNFVESGRTMDAQKVILRELEAQFGGAASAEGESTEALQQLQRMTEDAAESFASGLLPIITRFARFAQTELIPRIRDVVNFIKRNWPGIREAAADAFEGARRVIQRVMRWIDANVMPTIRSIVRNARRFWDEFGDDINTVFQFVRRTIERALRIIRGIIETVLAVIRGDWGKAWRSLQGVVREVFGGIMDFIRTIPRQVLALGKDIGNAIVRGILSGLRAIGGQITDFIWGLVPGPLRRFIEGGSSSGARAQASTFAGFGGAGGGARGLFRQMGGTIPGPPGAAIPITAHAGEVVLNPRQQRIVGIDRIIAALVATGGVIGGDSFASGGWVHPAPGTRIGGGPGQGTHSYSAPPNNWQSDAAYDLMGSDGTAVVAAGPGVIGAIRPFSSDPRFWGHAVYLNTNGVQLYYKHLKSVTVRSGQRVEPGQVLGYLGTGVNGGPHLHLGSTSVGALSAMVRAPAAKRSVAGESGHETPQSEKAPPLTPQQRLARAFKAAGAANPMAAARSILSAGAGDPASGVRGTSLSDAQQRGVSSIGRAAGTRELAKGGADAVARAAEAREDAERSATSIALQKNLAQVQGLIRKYQDRRRTLWEQIQKVGGRKDLKPARKRVLITQMRAARKRLKEDIDGLREVEKAIVEELNEIFYEAELDRLEDAESAGAPEGDSTADAGPTPDQQAQIDQANARADAAEQSARASEAFTNALRGSGDIDQPGGSVNVFMTVNGAAIYERNLGAAVVEAINRGTTRTTSVVTLRA
ncbi:peptidoglycan DD-metalloendopeptidase family protein [Miltoncostaea marina]|uniref:peptidoglycan DD-metalloendopeptidase family protein n=1 Tax=Miltoncostaea marina TaxID=2843215 RepID=UPI001C3E5C69|nr:peptidoglycan DD-metalloendopeptidase family protein [Miltoncostaea marina]